MFGFAPTSSAYSPYAGFSAPPRRQAPTQYTYSPFGGFVPVQAAPSFDPFGLDDYAPASAYDPYAARRAALERQALIDEQERQAALEEQRRRVLLQRRHQQQQQAAEEAEYIRRQMALQQAIEEEERARYKAAVKAAREEERRRREAVERRQEEILRRQREEQIKAEAVRAGELDHEEEDEEDIDAAQGEFVNPFFSWLYPHALPRRHHQQAQRPRPAQREPSHQAQPQSNTKHDSPAPAPVVESVRSVSPPPEPDHATFSGLTVEDVTSAAEAEPSARSSPTHGAADSPNTSTTRPATPQPSAEQMDAAVRAVQSAWKHHHRRQSHLTKLATLSAELDAKRDDFTLPETLDFLPPATSSGQPKLAFTSTNVPFRGYEDALLKLLTKVDEVQSGGDREIKKARKALVGDIEAQLARLDAHRERLAQEWKDTHPDGAGAANAYTNDNAAATEAEVVFHSEDAEMTDDSADNEADAETSSTVSVDSIDAKVAMMEDLLTAPKGHKLGRDGRAHSQRKRVARKSRKHRV